MSLVGGDSWLDGWSTGVLPVRLFSDWGRLARALATMFSLRWTYYFFEFLIGVLIVSSVYHLNRIMPVIVIYQFLLIDSWTCSFGLKCVCFST